MKLNIFIAFILSGLASTIAASTEDFEQIFNPIISEPDLYPFETKGEFCGFKNSSGKVIVEPKRYLFCSEFSDGLASVVITDWQGYFLQGFIDSSGDVAIPLEHPVQYIKQLSHFHEGLVMVYKPKSGLGDEDYFKGKFGYMNKQRELVIPYKYDVAFPFNEGLAVVGNYKDKINREDLIFGVINNKGESIVPLKFESLYPYHGGVAVYGEKNHWNGDKIFGFIDRMGEPKIKARWSDARDFSQGLAAVNLGSIQDPKWGYIDMNGNYVVVPHFTEASPFSDGLAVVSVDKDDDRKYGYINRQGEIVIKPKFISAGMFKNGIAEVQVKRGGKPYFIDKTGNPLLEK